MQNIHFAISKEVQTIFKILCISSSFLGILTNNNRFQFGISDHRYCWGDRMLHRIVLHSMNVFENILREIEFGFHWIFVSRCSETNGANADHNSQRGRGSYCICSCSVYLYLCFEFVVVFWIRFCICVSKYLNLTNGANG